MIGVSEDAAQWAVQSYITAIENDPNNPALRISLANLLANQQSYQEAVNILYQTINLKPNLPTTYYNLGLILQVLDQPDAYREARLAYQKALVLLDPNSEEYIVVNQKIEEIEFTMKEKGIEFEAINEVNTNAEKTEATNDETSIKEDSNKVSAPSITEQNLEVSGNEVTNVGEDVKL
jgi:tetratricopeptide (TPR) repeat protein